MMIQENWKNVLSSDPTDWLLEEEEPVIRYWVLRDILDVSEGEIEMARQQALKSEIVREVFSQQKPEGHWEEPNNMHAPHYTSTIYQLTLLGDIGAKADDERIVNGVETLLKTMGDDGSFPGHNPEKCEYGVHDNGLIIRFMHQFGLGDDVRLARIYEWIEGNQMDDGGWIGVQGKRKTVTAGCLNGTTNILWGLATTGRYTGTGIARRGLEYLNRVSTRRAHYNHQMSYPQFRSRWMDSIKLAEICHGLGVNREEEPLKKALDEIISYQEENGRWLERYVPYPQGHYFCKKMRKYFPKKGEPSRWVTAKALAILKKCCFQ